MSFLAQTSRVISRSLAGRSFHSAPVAANLTYEDVLNAKDIATAEAQFTEIKNSLLNYAEGQQRILNSSGKVDLDVIPKVEAEIRDEIAAANNVDTASFSPEVLAEFQKLRHAVQESYRKIENFSPGNFQKPNWEEIEAMAPSKSVFEEYKQIMNNFELPDIKMDVEPLISYFEKNNAELKAFAEQSQKRMDELGFNIEENNDPRFLLELGETKEEIAADLGLNADDPAFLEEYNKAVKMGRDPLLNEELAAKGDRKAIAYMSDMLAKTLGVKPKAGEEHVTVEDVMEAFPKWEEEIYDDLKQDAWKEESAAEMRGEVKAPEAPKKPEWLSHVELPSEQKK